jgi:uncharacterized membrane protein YGL010W
MAALFSLCLLVVLMFRMFVILFLLHPVPFNGQLQVPKRNNNNNIGFNSRSNINTYIINRYKYQCQSYSIIMFYWRIRTLYLFASSQTILKKLNNLLYYLYVYGVLPFSAPRKNCHPINNNNFTNNFTHFTTRMQLFIVAEQLGVNKVLPMSGILLWAFEVKRSFENELKFYKAHHGNSWNWAIHAVTVPMEWVSWFILLSYVRYLCVPLSSLVAMYYVALDVKMSLPTAAAITILGFSARNMTAWLTFPRAWWVALVLQAAAWAAQVLIGHRFFERNSPGMLKRLTLNSVVLSWLLAWEPFHFEFEEAGREEQALRTAK